MLFKTRGIVLNYIKYKDTSVIVKIYTEKFGLQTYIINGARSANTKTNKMAFLQPLVMVDLVVYHKPKVEINRISEIKPAYIYQTVHSNIKKIAVVTFLTEVLTKCLKEEEQNVSKYKFIQDSLIEFDHFENQYFHLQFLIKLSAFLGFFPSDSDEFFSQLTDHHYITVKESLLIKPDFEKILSSNSIFELEISPLSRTELINQIINFYALHIHNFGEVKSLKILREL